MRQINLANTNADASWLKALRNSRLESLNLGELEAIGDESIEDIIRFSDLKSLDIHSTSITDAGIHKLTKANKLRDIDIGGLEVTDQCVEALATFPLEKLEANLTKITEAGIMKMPANKSLKVISLIGVPMRLQGFKHLAGFESLEKLTIDQVDDAALTEISRLSNLKELFIGRGRISEVGLQKLAGLINLKAVSYTRDPDGPRISPESVRRLQKLMPKTTLLFFE